VRRNKEDRGGRRGRRAGGGEVNFGTGKKRRGKRAARESR
jgi:hypothetical protein